MTSTMGRPSSILSASKATTLPSGAVVAQCAGHVTTQGKENPNTSVMAALQEDSMKTPNQHCCFILSLRQGEHGQLAQKNTLSQVVI